MTRHCKLANRVTLILIATIAILGPSMLLAGAAAEIERDSRAALDTLYKTTPAAKALTPKAKAILVFPDIIKAGLIVGGQYGNGVLFKEGKAAGC